MQIFKNAVNDMGIWLCLNYDTISFEIWNSSFEYKKILSSSIFVKVDTFNLPNQNATAENVLIQLCTVDSFLSY